MAGEADTQATARPPSYSGISGNAPILDEGHALSPAFVRAVIDALGAGDEATFDQLIAPLHAADLADLLGLVTAAERRQLVKLLSSNLNPEVLSELDEDVREDVLRQLEPKVIARALQEMDSDDAVQVIEDLTREERDSVLAYVPKVDREAVEQALSFGEFTAARLMQREFVTVPPFWNVGQVIDYMRSAAEVPDQFFEVYVVDEDFHPIGSVPTSKLLQSRRTVPLREILESDIYRIPAPMNQEEVAYLFNQYHLLSAPVVDDDGRLVGMITVDDIVGVIQEETTEDILALGGVQEEGMSDGVLTITRRRFSWLFVNLATAIVASAVIAIFDEVIEKFVALAILMPIVASMGGNAGTQTLTVAVRALATRDLTPANAFRIIWREVLVGGLNGILFALVMGLAVVFWFESIVLGLVIAGAMVVNLLCAGAAGILVPLGLQRAGADPAIGSTVFVTTVTDVIGFFVFLGLGAYVLA